MRRGSGYALAAFAVIAAYAGLALAESFSKAAQAREAIVTRELPAIGEAARSAIRLAVARYLESGKGIAEDGFVRRWVEDPCAEPAALIGYLEDFRAGMGFVDSGVVTALDELLYANDGRILPLSRDDWESAWYYLFIDGGEERSVDYWWEPSDGSIRIYLNFRIADGAGGLLAVAGVSIDARVFGAELASFARRFGVRLFLARPDGLIVYSTDKGLPGSELVYVEELWGEEVARGRTWRTAGEGSLPAALTPSGSAIWQGEIGEIASRLYVERPPELLGEAAASMSLPPIALGLALAAALGTLSFAALRAGFKRQRESEAASRRDAALKAALLDSMGSRLAPLAASIHEGAQALIDKGEAPRGMRELARASSELSSLAGNLEGLVGIGVGLKGARAFSAPLSDIMGSLALDASRSARAKGAAVHASICGEALMVEGKDYFVRAALKNILDNAVGHTGPGGEVAILVKAEFGEAVVEIADSGPGLPEAAVRLIEASELNRPLGGGLGLFIARSFLDAIGARLEIAGNGPGGAILRARLRLARNGAKNGDGS